VLADGRVLLLTGAGPLLDSAEIYDPATGTWTPAANLNVARDFGHTATALADGRVLVASGTDESLPLGEEVLDRAEPYNRPPIPGH
jgi:hypothetical protein